MNRTLPLSLVTMHMISSQGRLLATPWDSIGHGTVSSQTLEPLHHNPAIKATLCAQPTPFSCPLHFPALATFPCLLRIFLRAASHMIQCCRGLTECVGCVVRHLLQLHVLERLIQLIHVAVLLLRTTPPAHSCCCYRHRGSFFADRHRRETSQRALGGSASRACDLI